MITRLSHVSLSVKDQDEAIRFYRDVLGMELRGDRQVGPDYRWVTVGVKGQTEVEIALNVTREIPGMESGATARQTFVFATDDCRKDVETLRSRGVVIALEPEQVPWGVQAVFQDLYGNSHVLVESPSREPAGEAVCGKAV